MNTRSKPINLMILDKDYTIACPEHERENLLACADYLSTKMKEVREQSKVMSSERILVMTALNIVHEFLQTQSQQPEQIDKIAEQPNDDGLDSKLNAMVDKISVALVNDKD